MNSSGMYDILVVGGGPAGLTAALYAARAGKRTAVLEKNICGGQILDSPKVENYPGLPGISGTEFAEALQAQVEAVGVEILYDAAARVEAEPEVFHVYAADGDQWDCRALVLATGTRHRGLQLPGEAALTGNGISYCAVCDGAFYAGKDVAVVGGGDTAVQDAVFLSEICASVTVLVRRDRFRAAEAAVKAMERRRNVRVLFQRTVTAYRSAEGVLTGLTLQDLEQGGQEKLAVDGLFLAVGQEPDAQAFRGLAPMDGAGYLLADETGVTAAPGVFAAGDCRKKQLCQLATAVGDGAAAAVSACRWLDRYE